MGGGNKAATRAFEEYIMSSLVSISNSSRCIIDLCDDGLSDRQPNHVINGCT